MYALVVLPQQLTWPPAADAALVIISPPVAHPEVPQKLVGVLKIQQQQCRKHHRSI